MYNLEYSFKASKVYKRILIKNYMDVKEIIILLVVIIAVIIILYSLFHKSAKKYYKKAEICHKKGAYYHDIGEEDLAKDYYTESEFFNGSL